MEAANTLPLSLIHTKQVAAWHKILTALANKLALKACEC